MLPTATEMIDYLNRFVRGQEQAKKDVTMAVYSHYLALAYAEQPEATCKDFGPQNILILGPTGSGKTYMIRKLAEFLKIPIVFGNAPSLSETGYVGEDVQSLVRNLLKLTGQNAAKAERGIIFLDEFDKIKKTEMTERDISGEGVQNGLLTFLNGGQTPILMDKNCSSHINVNTSKILFICTGAFVGLADIIRKRIHSKSQFGFKKSSSRKRTPDLNNDQALTKINPQDIVEFGFIPELIGRFGTIGTLSSLSIEDMVAILEKTDDSIIHKQQTFFKQHGIELEYTQPALKRIAEKSIKLNIGARGLNQLVLRSTDAVEWRLSELYNEGIRRIVIGPKVIDRLAEPRTYRRYKTQSFSEMKPTIDDLRQRALDATDKKNIIRIAEVSGIITNTSNWSESKIKTELDFIKENDLEWENTYDRAKKWWSVFEKVNAHRLNLVYRLAEELRNREATINEYFSAYQDSKTDNIQATLYYLDYKRLIIEEQNNKKGIFRTGQTVPLEYAGLYTFNGYLEKTDFFNIHDQGQRIDLKENDTFPHCSSKKKCWWKRQDNDV